MDWYDAERKNPLWGRGGAAAAAGTDKAAARNKTPAAVPRFFFLILFLPIVGSPERARALPYFFAGRKFKPAGSSEMSITAMKNSWAMSSMISGVTSFAASRVLW